MEKKEIIKEIPKEKPKQYETFEVLAKFTMGKVYQKGSRITLEKNSPLKNSLKIKLIK